MSSAMHSRWDELNNAGRSLAAQGDDAGAEAAFRAALTEAERGDGAPSRLATSLETLAQLKYRKEDRTAAEALFRCALALRDESADRTDVSTLSTLDCLADLCEARGAYAEADALLVRGLAAVDVPGADRDLLAERLNLLAQFRIERGNHAAAEPLLLRLVALKEEVSPHNPELAPILTSLATVKSALGHHDSAEHLLRQALAVTGADALLRKLAEEVAAQGRDSDAVVLTGEHMSPDAPDAPDEQVEQELPPAREFFAAVSPLDADEQPPASEPAEEPLTDGQVRSTPLPAWWTFDAHNSSILTEPATGLAAPPHEGVEPPAAVTPTADGARLFAAAAALALGTFEPPVAAPAAARAPAPPAAPPITPTARSAAAPATASATTRAATPAATPVAPPAPRVPTAKERLLETVPEDPFAPKESSLVWGSALSATQIPTGAGTASFQQFDSTDRASQPAGRITNRARVAAAAAIVVAAILAGRLVANARGGENQAPATAANADFFDGASSLNPDSVLTESGGSVGRTARSKRGSAAGVVAGTRGASAAPAASAASPGVSSAREEAAEAALDAALQAEMEAALPRAGRRSLPSVPSVRVKVDTRAVDESVKARTGGPIVTLPAIKAPEGPPPQVDGRQANGFPAPPKHI